MLVLVMELRSGLGFAVPFALDPCFAFFVGGGCDAGSSSGMLFLVAHSGSGDPCFRTYEPPPLVVVVAVVVVVAAEPGRAADFVAAPFPGPVASTDVPFPTDVDPGVAAAVTVVDKELTDDVDDDDVDLLLLLSGRGSPSSSAEPMPWSIPPSAVATVTTPTVGSSLS